MAWDLRSNIESETEGALIAPDLTEAQIDGLYPEYPFDRNPVIVPKISTVPAVGTAPDLPAEGAGETEIEGEAGDDAGDAAGDTNPASPSAAGTGTAAGASAAAGIEWSEVDSVIAAVGELVGDAGEGIGSNSWVVSGSLTDTGMPLLANDPHLSRRAPRRSRWRAATTSCSRCARPRTAPSCRASPTTSRRSQKTPTPVPAPAPWSRPPVPRRARTR